MSSLIKENTKFQLDNEKLGQVLQQIKEKLQGRVQEAYIFGSAATGQITPDSDIDLILVVATTDTPFVQRGLAFTDLFDVYPCLDILVYTPDELARQLADSEVGFWKSVRTSMRSL